MDINAAVLFKWFVHNLLDCPAIPKHKYSLGLYGIENNWTPFTFATELFMFGDRNIASVNCLLITLTFDHVLRFIEYIIVSFN